MGGKIDNPCRPDGIKKLDKKDHSADTNLPADTNLSTKEAGLAPRNSK